MLLFGGRIREISLSGKLRPLIARGIESGLWSHHCLLQKTDTHLNLQGGSLQEPIIDSTDNAGIMISHGALYLDEPKTCRLPKASNMYLYITKCLQIDALPLLGMWLVHTNQLCTQCKKPHITDDVAQGVLDCHTNSNHCIRTLIDDAKPFRLVNF
jgi:hypothetical protein